MLRNMLLPQSAAEWELGRTVQGNGKGGYTRLHFHMRVNKVIGNFSTVAIAFLIVDPPSLMACLPSPSFSLSAALIVVILAALGNRSRCSCHTPSHRYGRQTLVMHIRDAV